jgi:Uma2 family endonuclease
MATLLEAPAAAQHPIIPWLNNGDHMGAAEFMRRYEAMEEAGDHTRAELINGVVYFMMPVHFSAHGKSDSILQQWLAHYSTFVPNVEHASNATVKLGRKDVSQPDGFLWDRSADNARLSNDDYLEGAPELVAETSASSASYDCREKLESYLRAGVREYIIWRTLDAELDWFTLEDDEYIPITADAQGIVRSRYFNGLWLNKPALLAHDRRAVLATLEEGIKARPDA